MNRLLACALALVVTACSSGPRKTFRYEVPAVQAIAGIERVSVERCEALKASGTRIVYLDATANSGLPHTIPFDAATVLDDLAPHAHDTIVTFACDCEGETAAILALNLRRNGFSRAFPLKGGTEALKTAAGLLR